MINQYCPAGGWTSASASSMKLMAPQVQRAKKGPVKPGPQVCVVCACSHVLMSNTDSH